MNPRGPWVPVTLQGDVMNEESFAWVEDSLIEIFRGTSPTASLIARVAKKEGAARAQAAATQAQLQARAAEKFAGALAMRFTRAGLEMATHEGLAAFHASLVPPGMPAVDLTAGIGADAMALGRRGPVLAWERDPETARCLIHNLERAGVQADVRVGDSMAWLANPDRPDDVMLFADPARREGARRTLNPDDFQPDPRVLAAAMRRAAGGLMKLSPMLADEYLADLGGRVIWISHRGQCPEALVAFGVCGDAVQGDVVQVETGAWLTSGPDAPMQTLPDEYIFDLDPAAVRGHARGSFGLAGLGESHGYLTGPDDRPSPWLRGYRVRGHAAWHADKVKRELRAQGLEIEIVKTRRVSLDPPAVRRQLRGTGKTPAVLLLYPIGPKIHAVWAEALPRG